MPAQASLRSLRKLGCKRGHDGGEAATLEQTELAVFRLSARQLGALVLEQLGLDVAQERGGFELAHAPAPEPLARPAEDQAVLRPRHADVEQAALLRDRRLVRRPPMERQD